MPNWDEGFWDSGNWDDPGPVITLPLKKQKINRRTMASNPTPDNEDIAVALAEDLADGCHELEVTLGIVQNTEARLRAAVTAVLTTRQTHATKLQALRDRVSEQQGADAAGSVTLTNCQLRFFKLFGKQFNEQWQLAGWPGQTASVPTQQDQRFTLLNKLKIYFTANPASESTELEATAAACLAAHTAVSDARLAVHAAETEVGDAFKAHKDAVKALRKRIRGLLDELPLLIAEDDQRYGTFGLNIPAHPSPPQGIASLTLAVQGGGKLHAAWTYATRMVKTRLLLKRTGIDDEFQSIGTVEGLEKTLEGLAPGEVQVQAVPYNDAGDGPGSPVVSVTVT